MTILNTVKFKLKNWTMGGSQSSLLYLIPLAFLYGTTVSGAQKAVPTFQSIGLYWSPGSGSATSVCKVTYREKGSTAWSDGLPLWFDKRNSEFRGSLVNLKPNTLYEIQLSLQNSTLATLISCKTWSEEFPIAKTVYLPSGTSSKTFTVSEPGTSTGYVLYSASPSSSTIDVNSLQDYCINVQASYVIIRGVKCKNASRDGINLGKGVHDVIIEHCDISGWGRVDKDGFGIELDAGVKALSGTNVERIILQYNKIHHPRSNSNTWDQTRTGTYSGSHPAGPCGIGFITSAGNHTIRFNEVYSDENHLFNDGITGSYNNTTQGFPGPDTDIYGNIVKNTIDDALEIDGGGRNVRIWGNLIDTTYVGISSSPCSVGPLYVFRNVMGFSRRSKSSSVKGVFAKTGDQSAGVGMQYWFHNTVLQPGGATIGISSSGSGSLTMLLSMNNILNGRISIDARTSTTTNQFDYDLCSGEIRANSGAETHAIKGTPQFMSKSGDLSRNSELFQLASNSPGINAGIQIPNFNDDYFGSGPDVGACESGIPVMLFGLAALQIKTGTSELYNQNLISNSAAKGEGAHIFNKRLNVGSFDKFSNDVIYDVQGRSINGSVPVNNKMNTTGILITKQKSK
jgi:hypothetical protein